MLLFLFFLLTRFLSGFSELTTDLLSLDLIRFALPFLIRLILTALSKSEKALVKVSLLPAARAVFRVFARAARVDLLRRARARSCLNFLIAPLMSGIGANNTRNQSFSQERGSC